MRTLLTLAQYHEALDELKAAFSFFPYDQNLRRSLAVAYSELAFHTPGEAAATEAVALAGRRAYSICQI